MSKKFTMASMKSFVKKANGLQIFKQSSFDGMTDCVEICADQNWKNVDISKIDVTDKYRMGISGAWFVGGGGDYFTTKEVDGKVVEVEIYNCCGNFSLRLCK
jgi:hypothetical protein